MSEFQEGDEVRFIERIDENDNHVKEGDVGRVSWIGRSKPWPVEVSWYSGKTSLHSFDQLEKTEENNMSDFKPFYISVDGPQHSKLLQEIAFEEGYVWRGCQCQKVRHADAPYLSFNGFGDEEIGYSHTGDFMKNEDLPTVESLEEYRKALRGNYDWEEIIEIGGYEVEFHPDGEHPNIKVGCEEYHYADIKHVYSCVKQAENGLYPDYSIKIEHDEVGEIPFEKIEAIYNRIQD